MDEIPRRRIRIKNRNIKRINVEPLNDRQMRAANENFYGDSGLTMSRANHISSSANEIIRKHVQFLASMRLYTEYIEFVSDDNPPKVSKKGWSNDDLNSVEESISLIAKAHALQAWIGEALKDKKEWIDYVKRMSEKEYADMMGIEYPTEPVKAHVSTREEIIASMSVKDRNRILMLEAMASTYGRYIHPIKGRNSLSNSFTFADGSGTNFSEAITLLGRIENNPTKVIGEGKDGMTMYTYKSSCDRELVDGLFSKLYAQQRKYQEELNGCLYRIDKQISDEEIKASSEYAAALEEYNAKCREIRAQLKAYIESETARISELRIVIPNDLKGIYELARSLDKAE